MTYDSPEFKERYAHYLAEVENALRTHTPPPATRPAVLHEAMRYSLEAGGKRLRPILLLAAGELFPTEHDVLPAAVALECVHTYSLIHDDLPCMDNSDLRRGKATCHKKFGESTALLAGDALLTHAFYLLASAYRATPAVATDLVFILGKAAGSQELIGGQVEDTIGERGELTAERLDFIHLNKTAALITAPFTMAAVFAGGSEEAVSKARQIGTAVGLAFQIVDDILDVTSDAATMGKPVNADVENKKVTYPRVHGLEASRRRVRELTDAAVSLCAEFDAGKGFLAALVRGMANRVN